MVSLLKVVLRMKLSKNLCLMLQLLSEMVWWSSLSTWRYDFVYQPLYLLLWLYFSRLLLNILVDPFFVFRGLRSLIALNVTIVNCKRTNC